MLLEKWLEGFEVSNLEKTYVGLLRDEQGCPIKVIVPEGGLG
jgi:hypothetical protein